MTKPTVTVVIPTHNRPEMLIDAVLSCLKQSHKPIEIIVIDNGSTMDNVRLATVGLDRVANRDIVLQHIVLPEGNVSAARNAGISMANGEYVALLDDDDTFSFDKLQIQLKTMLNFDNELDVLGCLSSTQKPQLQVSDFVTMAMSVNNMMMYPSAVLMKTEVGIDIPFDPGVGKCEDYEWMIRVTEKYNVFRTIDRLFHRRVHETNDTHTFAKEFDEIRKRILLKMLPVAGNQLGIHIRELLKNYYGKR